MRYPNPSLLNELSGRAAKKLARRSLHAHQPKEPQSMWNEFKKFIARGNVIDLAVGVVVGAAFTAIVNSMVADLFNPLLGIVIGGLDFSEYYINLSDTAYASSTEAEAAGAPIIKYGVFINAVVKFIIVAFVVFLLVRQINRVKAQFEAKAADTKNTEVPTPADILLLTEIRDLLKAQKS